MKRAAMVVVVLALVTFGLAQPQATTQTPPAAQADAAQTGAAQPAAAPAGKRPPQAKTQPEFDAYKAAMTAGDFTAEEKAQMQKDPSTIEKTRAAACLRAELAADDFATKFPDSELRTLLYKSAMHGYQSSNNGDKMIEMGRSVLKIDPDDPEALVGVAEVLAERTRDTDLDKDQRLDEAMKMAQRAVETVDTDTPIPAGTPQEKIDAYKGFLRSTAYSIMGTLQFNRDKFADAENYFRKSIDAFPSQPDPIVVLRLALALDKQNRYVDALKEASHAVELTQDGTPAGKLARQEQDRLMKLTQATPASKPQGGSAENQAPPKN